MDWAICCGIWGEGCSTAEFPMAPARSSRMSATLTWVPLTPVSVAPDGPHAADPPPPVVPPPSWKVLPPPGRVDDEEPPPTEPAGPEATDALALPLTEATDPVDAVPVEVPGRAAPPTGEAAGPPGPPPAALGPLPTPPLVPTASELPPGVPVGTSAQPTSASTTTSTAAASPFSAGALLRIHRRNCRYWLTLASPVGTGATRR